MSFLTPLYILGTLVVAAPILFHLIRRMPKGEVPFSSLMFLTPTPPRLTRRSRLDNWLLLLLRAAALCLLAFAFARPFLRESARADFGDVERRRMAVLVDTSASMRRGDLWSKAKAAARDVIAACRPNDQIAVFAFDSSAHPLLGFEESAQLEPSKRQAVADASVERLAPTWEATNLGQALIDAVTALEEVADATEKTARMPRRVIVISDLQQGSRLDALGDFEWPSDVDLELKPISNARSNAGLQWLTEAADAETADGGARLRVRVSNDSGSRQESFQLVWVDKNGTDQGPPVDVYVPPGESRVAHVPQPPTSAAEPVLKLKGDQEPFDNTLFLVTERKEESKVIYLGPDAADDPAGLLYFLERVFPGTPRRSVQVVAKLPSAPLDVELDRSIPLVVLASDTTPENVARLQPYLRDGGTVLFVALKAGPAESLSSLSGIPIGNLAESTTEHDVLLREIAFDHPLFAPLAGAQFNDFTKIRFWKHRKINPDALADARVLARFEDGDPAIVEKTVGRGRVVVFASSWSVADSQLARSSKFVPLMAGLLEARQTLTSDTGNHLVRESVALPPSHDATHKLVVHKPDGSVTAPAPGADVFSETDQPGVYTIDTTDGPRSFVVNLDPAESKTSPLHVETLEQFGCRLASHTRKVDDREHLRQLQNLELENRQKLWRWLIVAAVGVLIVETWLAGRVRSSRAARAEAVT